MTGATQRHRSGVGFGLLVSATLLSLDASPACADGGIEPIRVDYRPGPTCPSRDVFLSEIRRAAPRLRLASGPEQGRPFIVTFEADGDVVHTGHLRIDRSGVTVGSRDVRGANCEEVARVLAFAVALAYDPEALPVAPWPLPSPLPPPPSPLPFPIPPPPPAVTEGAAPVVLLFPPPTDSPRRPLVSTPPAHLWWALAGHATIASDLSPNPGFGGGLVAEIGRKSQRLDASVRVGVDYSVSASESVDGARVAFSSVLGLIEGCLTPWAIGRFSISTCGRVDTGARIVSGEGIPAARTVVRPWVALGPAAHVRWRATGPFFVEVGGELFFATIQDSITVDPRIPVYSAGLLGGRGDFGVGLEFR